MKSQVIRRANQHCSPPKERKKMSSEKPKVSPEFETSGMNLQETELTLGLPGESRTQKSGTKRGFSETVDLCPGSTSAGKEEQSENEISGTTKPPTAK
ncbi:unnamed protein product [Ilex paraguariensis]|uniref:Uncharacterized protein n=1 Tax=Ilex paraguariensis TaxID=185542 RepID=A0ABC8TYR9_9AQUA